MLTYFLISEDGATMPEYGLMVTLIAMAAVVAVMLFGESVNGLFDQQELLSALKG
jgi:Flp pilus assembly pilin Flp